MRALCLAALLLWPTVAWAEEDTWPPRWAHRSLFLATEVALLVDLGQTLDIKHHPDRWETNPVLGRHPSDATVYRYFLSGMVLYGLAYAYLPPKWSTVLLTGQLGFSVGLIQNNVSLGLRVRF